MQEIVFIQTYLCSLPIALSFIFNYSGIFDHSPNFPHDNSLTDKIPFPKANFYSINLDFCDEFSKITTRRFHVNGIESIFTRIVA